MVGWRGKIEGSSSKNERAGKKKHKWNMREERILKKMREKKRDLEKARKKTEVKTALTINILSVMKRLKEGERERKE